MKFPKLFIQNGRTILRGVGINVLDKQEQNSCNLLPGTWLSMILMKINLFEIKNNDLTFNSLQTFSISYHSYKLNLFTLQQS
mmetsp:Transcript_26027/g.53859  ORF Transcript_26027/g.53859 Transcript_26027/m.53859 type:complete len:82 (+) Transcript_26027:141-386(+)